VVIAPLPHELQGERAARRRRQVGAAGPVEDGRGLLRRSGSRAMRGGVRSWRTPAGEGFHRLLTLVAFSGPFGRPHDAGEAQPNRQREHSQPHPPGPVSARAFARDPVASRCHRLALFRPRCLDGGGMSCRRKGVRMPGRGGDGGTGGREDRIAPSPPRPVAPSVAKGLGRRGARIPGETPAERRRLRQHGPEGLRKLIQSRHGVRHFQPPLSVSGSLVGGSLPTSRGSAYPPEGGFTGPPELLG